MCLTRWSHSNQAFIETWFCFPLLEMASRFCKSGGYHPSEVHTLARNLWLFSEYQWLDCGWLKLTLTLNCRNDHPYLLLNSRAPPFCWDPFEEVRHVVLMRRNGKPFFPPVFAEESQCARRFPSPLTSLPLSPIKELCKISANTDAKHFSDQPQWESDFVPQWKL